MEKIIGRDKELERLAEIARSGRPEFVAVYGRRRVGKTQDPPDCFYNVMAEKTQKSSASVDESARRIQRLS